MVDLRLFATTGGIVVLRTTKWNCSSGSVSDRYGNISRHWGDISLVLYYNRPLTDDEILKNYDTFRRRFDL